jgi:hypothetical protein
MVVQDRVPHGRIYGVSETTIPGCGARTWHDQV